MENLASGNSMVDAMGMFNMSGNIIPQIWYKTITKTTGKPYLLAITLLSDIVYWYRPAEVRDEASGQIIGWHKKFKGDMLQKTYQQYADLFGESKRSVKAALDRLEELGVIWKEFRDIDCGNGLTMYNLMYIALDVDVLTSLTFPEKRMKSPKTQGAVPPPTKNCTTPLQKNVTPSAENCDTSYKKLHEAIQKNERDYTGNCNIPQQKDVPPHTKNCGTNTYITTKNTDIDSIHPINQPDNKESRGGQDDDRMDEVNAYIEMIKENIEYEYHMKYDSFQDRELFEELFGVICDIVCFKRKSVKANGVEYPYELVKAKFLKLGSGHLEYVINSMKSVDSDIANVRAYMVTALYNAPDTINHYYKQKVQYDMHSGI